MPTAVPSARLPGPGDKLASLMLTADGSRLSSAGTTKALYALEGTANAAQDTSIGPIRQNAGKGAVYVDNDALGPLAETLRGHLGALLPPAEIRHPGQPGGCHQRHCSGGISSWPTWCWPSVPLRQRDDGARWHRQTSISSESSGVPSRCTVRVLTRPTV
jgi:hypothetical protein